MERHDERVKVGRKTRPLLLLTGVLVVVSALGVVWVATRPSTSTACTLGATRDEVGAPTPEASRARWPTEHGLGIDVEHPGRTSGSGDRVTATYVLDGPERGPTDLDRTYFRKVVTERGADGVWRVVSVNTCEQWRSA